MSLRLCLLLLCLLEGTAALKCYHCSDSSNEKGKNRCQAWVRTMRRQRLDNVEKGTNGTFIKDCSGFGNLPEDQVFCSITEVKQGGRMISYIRGCSDGRRFFGADYNEEFLQGNVIPNNKTTCRYSGQGYVACVTICGRIGEADRDFCNGPDSATDVRGSLLVLISALMLHSVLRNIVS